jgi:hypothetical protein
MTFQTAVWAVDGNLVDAAYARLMLQAAVLGSQGVVGHLDCQVNATTPSPTAGIVITSGAVTVSGVEAPYQGSYYGWNVGNDTTLSIAATGGAARSDMVVVRAEDPTWSGSPWGNPASGQILFPRVISGVSAGAVVPPGGQSCIPLARIDMPSSVSTVQQSYIHDLRQVAVPQVTQIVLWNGGPGTPVQSTNSLSATVQWPAGATWQIQIPSWATLMTVAWSCNELLWISGIVRGFIWPVIGSSVSAPTVTTQQTIVSIPTSDGPWRHTIGGGAMVAIPPSIRGTTQTFQFAQKTDGSNTGRLSYGEHASVTAIVQFQQQAALL